MASTRRVGATDSKTRGHLMDVAEEMILTEGYASVTSRKLGARAGVSPQLVHYYFRTMDELFVEVFRRRAEEGLARITDELAADRSLPNVWRLTSNPVGARLNVEYAALANHRPEVGAEVARHGARFRELQSEAVAARMRELGVDEERWPPVVALLAMTGLAQIMSIESAFGFTLGHAEATAFVEQLLARLEADAPVEP